jgi:hypothetical protein
VLATTATEVNVLRTHVTDVDVLKTDVDVLKTDVDVLKTRCRAAHQQSAQQSVTWFHTLPTHRCSTPHVGFDIGFAHRILGAKSKTHFF